jgi:hypothetical protein
MVAIRVRQRASVLGFGRVDGAAGGVVTRAEVERLLDLVAEEDGELESLVMKLLGEVLASAALEMPVTFEETLH